MDVGILVHKYLLPLHPTHRIQNLAETYTLRILDLKARRLRETIQNLHLRTELGNKTISKLFVLLWYVHGEYLEHNLSSSY